jgi:hypothetical protein
MGLTGKTIPCLLPSVLDFGLVAPGENPGGMAGVCNWKTAGHVTARFNDHSGGLFTGFVLGVYDVQVDDTSDVPPRPGKIRPVRWILVEMASGDGSTPLPVSPGQTVGVGVFFNAPGQATGVPFTADIEIMSSGSAVAATIPVTATVEALDVTAAWVLANPFGIHGQPLAGADPMGGAWYAGHVNDVLVLGGQNEGALLIGTDTGGVWRAERLGSVHASPVAAEPLTDDWDSNTVTCLCQGPHSPNHVYVGTSPGVLYETEDLVGWRDTLLPGAGNIYKIAVTSGSPRRVIVASDGGIFWSKIPQPGGPYQWHRVNKQANGHDFPAGGSYSGLALGPNDRIVVAAWGANLQTGLYGIFYGEWSSNPISGDLSLLLTQVPDANMPQAPPQSLIRFSQGMGRTSLASCLQNPLAMYAVSANAGDNQLIYAVLGSADGGIHWTNLQPTLNGQPLSDHAGSQGNYNNCIAVGPTDQANDRRTVLIGWQHGTFLSTDSGKTFTNLSGPEMHDDVHGLYFDSTDRTNSTFYICSDGGVIFTADGGRSFDSSFNRYLANLECYCAIPRNFWGSLSVRDNFLASGLQDNSNVYCVLRPGNNPNVTPWVQLDGADGGWVAVLATGQLLGTRNSGGQVIAQSYRLRSDIPTDFARGNEVPIGVESARDKKGLFAHAVDPVAAPSYRNKPGQLMYAVARGQTTSEYGSASGLQTVYGLFAESTGDDLHWEKIANVTSDAPGDEISALATLDDGTSVLAGTSAGRLFLIKLSPNGPVSGQQLVVSLPPGTPQGSVDRIVFASASLAFATFNSNDGSHVLRFDGSAWKTADAGLPGGAYYGLARDGYSRTWTCTDDKVFVTRDDGLTWKNASTGLPKRPHCADLRYNYSQQNPPLLYLSTYGHSVWVTDVIG